MIQKRVTLKMMGKYTTTYKESAAQNIGSIWAVIKSDNASEKGYSYIYDPKKQQYVFQQVTE